MRAKFIFLASIMACLLLSILWRCTDDVEPLVYGKKKAPYLSFSTLLTEKRLLGVSDILEQINEKEKKGYRVKAIILDDDIKNFVSVRGEIPNIEIHFKKTGVFTATIILQKADYQDATVKARFEILRQEAADLSFRRPLSEVFVPSGSFTAAEILGNIEGDKDGYTLKEITDIAPKGVAKLSGTAPDFKLLFQNVGVFSAILVLQHPTKKDATVRGFFAITRGIAEKLTFVLKTNVMKAGGSFTEQDIFNNVKGLKKGYTLHMVKDISDTNIAQIKSDKKSIAMKKVGTFTATLVFWHPHKAAVTIKKAAFKITNVKAAVLGFKKYTATFPYGGIITSEQILKNITGDKSGYRISNIIIKSPLAEVSNSAKGSGSFRNTLITLFNGGNNIAVKAVGNFTAILVLSHPKKADVTIQKAAFEISKAPAAATPTWSKQKITIPIGGSITADDIKAGFAMPSGYTLKQVRILSDSQNSGAVVGGSKPNFTISNYNKSTTLNLQIVLEHLTREDITITNAAFEIFIYKPVGQKFKFTNYFGHKKTIPSAEILKQIPTASSKGYSIKQIKIEGANAAYATVKGLNIEIKKAGHFKATIILGKQNFADSVLRNCSFKVVPETYFSFTNLTRNLDKANIIDTADILKQIRYASSKGYALKEIKIYAADAAGTAYARVIGSKPNFQIELLKFGSFQMRIVLEKAGYLDPDAFQGSVRYNFDKTFNENLEFFNSIAKSNDGGYILVGNTNTGKGAAFIGNEEFLVLKLDAKGKVQKKTTLGYGKAHQIKQTSDGGHVIVGSIRKTQSDENDLLVLKLDADGNETWRKTFGEKKGKERGISVYQTKDGGYIVAGIILKERLLKKRQQFWILKLGASGDQAWEKIHGGLQGERVRDIKQTADGGYIAVGSTKTYGAAARAGAGQKNAWVLKLQKDGKEDWEEAYGPRVGSDAKSIVQTSDGGYIVLGENEDGLASRSAWLFKIDAKGVRQWEKRFDTDRQVVTYLEMIKKDGAGEYMIVGAKYDTSNPGASSDRDAWIARIDDMGQILWQKTFMKTLNNDFFIDLVKNADGGYTIIGENNGYFPSRSSGWVLKIDKDGNL